MPFHLLASAATPPYLGEAVALVVGSALIAYISYRVRVQPIIGFLVTGVVMGPGALALVRSNALIESVAEIGVVLLLFTLGIEFSLDRLARIKRAIFLGGGLQLTLTVAATTLILSLLGVDWRTGVFTGCLVALSSTAIALKVMEESGGTSKHQLALGILIFQDLAIVALVLLLPMLGGTAPTVGEIAAGLGKAAGIVAVTLVVARRLMPPILERVARTCSQEIFLLTVIAICLGTAWLTSLAGVSLSLGAFLAGLVVSESRFSHHAFAEILPLQILFSAVFFVSVGLLLDVRFFFEHPFVIVAVVVAIAIVKVLTTGIAALLLRSPFAVTVSTAFLLAQIGEFSFVLARVGRDAGPHPAGVEGLGRQTFIAAAVLLMIATPAMAKLGSRLERRQPPQPAAEPESAVEHIALQNHVIVAGYGSSARYLTRVLRDSGVPFVILTLSPTGATEAQRDGLQVVVGDYSRRVILAAAAVDQAKMLVIPDDTAGMARRVAAVARGLNPTLQIVARTSSNEEVDGLLRDGADQVLVDELEVAIQLFTRVLTAYRVDLDEIDDHVTTVRAGGYAALRTGIADVPLVVCGDLDEECFDTRSFTVRGGTAATRMTIGELAAQTGVNVVAVERGVERIDAPAPDFHITAGDRLTARASASAFAAAANLLRTAAAVALPEATARTVELTERQRTATNCAHAATVRTDVTSTAAGCEDCVAIGFSDWVHLRICMTCGGVRCCDSSPYKHATAHHHASSHPIIRSWEPGEGWAWCYVDEVTF